MGVTVYLWIIIVLASLGLGVLTANLWALTCYLKAFSKKTVNGPINDLEGLEIAIKGQLAQIEALKAKEIK